MRRSFILFLLILNLHVFSNEFHLRDYENIAIATDLEPDDVLALKIIFQEANKVYLETQKKYPIDLIIVGEGNTSIKRLRMEKLLQEYLEIPESVKIDVVEGKATEDNIFPFDGEELFSKNFLKEIPYAENGEKGVEALNRFVAQSSKPLIIQIKPGQELLSIPIEDASKTAILFYGSFNFRKTVKDGNFIYANRKYAQGTESEKLQKLLDYFSNHFLKIGIIETFGILGEESAVDKHYLWTQSILDRITDSQNPFIHSFRDLVHNWNRYLLEAELEELHQAYPDNEILSSLIQKWDQSRFLQFYENNSNNQDISSSLNFIKKVQPSSGIQFTLADIALALAVTDRTNFFTAQPVRISVNKRLFLEGTADESSNVFYYNRVDKETFAQILNRALEEIEAGSNRCIEKELLK